MTLENEEIKLRFMTIEDTDHILKWRNSESVVKRFLYRKPLTREDHLNWIKNKVETGKVAQFIIIIKETGQEIGSTYLRDIDLDNKTAEFGIFIGEQINAGHGYGTMAQYLTLKYAYEKLGIEEIQVEVIEDNEPSLKMNYRNGFHVVPELTKEMELDGKMQKVLLLKHSVDIWNEMKSRQTK